MSSTATIKYDYIIAGSGCAGLSLLYRLLLHPDLKHKNILVLDKDAKKVNDRTWCYWDSEAGMFDFLVTHKWDTLAFLTSNFTHKFDLKKYSYKMIRGIDFYNHILSFAASYGNVTFKQEHITSITTTNKDACVTTTNNSYKARYVFNSTNLFYPVINEKNSLLQHFQGWEIKTNTPVFDSSVGTLMDFRLSQKHGTTFMYVLPTSENEALVEYTLFTEKVLEKEAYHKALKGYIKEYLKVDEYEVTHTEYGIIPMSLGKFSRSSKAGDAIINIGTAGGFTKASSGYTFQFVQENTKKIIENLASGKHPNPKMSFREKMFHWYDRTVLDVMITKKMTGKEIFSLMFQKISPETILAFLGNESSVMDDVKIMKSLPLLPFLTSGIKRL